MKKSLSHITTSLLLGIMILGTIAVPKIAAANTLPACVVAGTCFAGTGGKVMGWAADALALPLGWVMSLVILPLIGIVTYFSGTLLNYIIDFTIVDMADNMFKTGVINETWRTVRDIANMFFIFLLLYASIKMILGIGSDVRRLIVRIVVVALLVNFSLFITKVVIDASNILALTFYDAIAPGVLDGNPNLLQKGISNSLMEPLKIPSILKVAGAFDGSKLLVIGALGTILALVAAFVFFAISILFLIRFIVLMFVLILSPLAVVAYALPGLGKYQKQWTDALFGQAFFAPIYFFLTWIVIKISRGFSANVTGDFSTLGGVVDSNGQSVADPGTIGILVHFFIVIGLLIMSLVIAKEWANKAGGGISKVTGWATGFAGGTVFGGVGAVGRKTIGRAGQSLADSGKMKDLVARGGAYGVAGRLALATGKKASTSNFDLRGTAIGGSLDAGKPKKNTSYAQGIKDRAKREEEIAKSLKPSGAEATRDEQAVKDAKSRLDQAAKDAEQRVNTSMKADIETAEQAVKDAESNPVDGGLKVDEARKRLANLVAMRDTQIADETKAAQEALAEEKKIVETTLHARRAEARAQQIEGSFFGSIMGGNKEAAAAVRKAAKKKTEEEDLAEAAKKWAEKQAKEKKEAEGAAEESGEKK